MEPTVRVQVTLSMDLRLEKGQTNYDVARGVQQQVNALLQQDNFGRIDSIKIFEGQVTALTLSMNEPAVELKGQEGVNGWELARKGPAPQEQRHSNLPLGARSTSNSVSIALSPAEAQEWGAAPKGLGPTIRQKRNQKKEKKVAKVPRPKKKTQNKQFAHGPADRNLNKRDRRKCC